MNYPLWIMQNLDVGALVAMIAIPHVYISHLAVGGGLFLVVTETMAYRRNNMLLLDYVRRHTWFFLLLTMVFGGISGVGIWFIISLAQPAATSTLIHEFVFGWATEWVFFIVEITALLIYHYLFTKMRPKPHMIIGWIYFAAAWLSMVIIHGILSFMLTPGRWVETHNFWHGFFNPGYFPGLLFRTSMALTIAGLFGLITAARTKDSDLRTFLSRYCAIWVSLPFVTMLLTGWWYWAASDSQLGGNMLKYFYFMRPFDHVLIWGSVIIFLGGVVMLIRQPRFINVALVTVLVVIGLGWMGSFEFLRENARRPWIIHNYMYSNSILARDVDRLDKEGWLKNAVWARTDTPEHSGQDILTHECLVCHTLNGRRALMPRTARYDEFGMLAQLTGMGKVQPYMPKFVGTDEEKQLLAKYIVEDLHGKQPVEKQPVTIQPSGVTVTNEFVSEAEAAAGTQPASEYVLLCWNDLGMHTWMDNDDQWQLMPPDNTLWALVIKRGDPPQRMTEGVTVSYAVEPDHVDQAGNPIQGEFKLHADKQAYVAEQIPVTPYSTDGSFNPYPMVDITVTDTAGNTLAATKATAPTSTEMGCKNCHGGKWSHGVAGMERDTADSILAIHDQLSGTDLLAQAEAGKPPKCRDCHADPLLGAEGDPDRLNLSASIHGFHANYMSNLGAEACEQCHPADPEGATRCLRGLHSASVACIDCHGTMSDHALSLLKAEKIAGKSDADRLMRNLKPVQVASVDDINGRIPWADEPDCLNCHIDYQLQSFESFNHWTNGFGDLFRQRVDMNGMMCAACHGSPHAIFPADNAYGEAVDNYQSLQYLGRTGTIGGERSCTTCHTVEPSAGMHHLNMRRGF